MRPRWLRFAHAELRPLLYLPQQPSYNKRLRRWSRPCTGCRWGSRSPARRADERQVLLDLLHQDPALTAPGPDQVLIADKNYDGQDFETALADAGIRLLRRARNGEPEREGGRFFKPLRQTIESIFQTLKGQLDLERHGGHTLTGLTG